jgi:hypothetical protein
VLCDEKGLRWASGLGDEPDSASEEPGVVATGGRHFELSKLVRLCRGLRVEARSQTVALLDVVGPCSPGVIALTSLWQRDHIGHNRNQSREDCD